MAPLELQGINLGEKHRNYNKVLKEALSNNQRLEPGDFNSGENDLENFLKIDLACTRRDVEYILNILKCEDTLYVSRAIKRSTWLITDSQYSHIINPNYLQTELFPQMIFKARVKLMSHIRLNLKDETRVEEFYAFFKDRDIKAALKWLPYCSVPFIEKEVEAHYEDVSTNLIKRLCERSISILEIYLKHCTVYDKRDKLKATLYLIKTNTDKYLDICDPLENYQIPKFGPKYTEIIMKNSPQRIKDKLEIYGDKVHAATFARCIKNEDVKEFLIQQSLKAEKPDNGDLGTLFNYDNLRHFMRYLPKEGRFEFIKKYIIEKKGVENLGHMASGDNYYGLSLARCTMSYCDSNSSSNIYRWYRFAPFDVAFQELTKMIRAESSPTERIAMFLVLLTCADRNPQNQQALLKYYYEKHINEPFKFKIQVINMFLTKTNSHRFNEETWNMLNKLFHSSEVYVESDNNVQSCIEAIILYKIVHNETVPEVILNKFTFSSLNSVQKKLNNEESGKVFQFLFDYQKAKIQDKKVSSENEFMLTVDLLSEMLSLLADWKKELVDYPWVLDKIKELLKIKSENSWRANLASLYNKKRSWKRAMFNESLAISPSDATCYNALKHDPTLLSRYQTELEEFIRKDNLLPKRLLCALRVYWPQTLAAEWTDSYRARLDRAGGHKAVVQGICVLMPLRQLIDILKKYAPTENKINWTEDNEILLSLRKQLAKNMHLSRPHPPLDVVVIYAKGDYLQFVLPSLNSVLVNISASHIRKQLSQFLNAPVSFQKHGIRLALSKLEPGEQIQILSEIWNKTRNPTIRAVIFKQTYELLCQEKKPAIIEELWNILSGFIDKLSSEENKTIYDILGKVDKVPLLVRGKYFEKAYRFLKSLPVVANCQDIVYNLAYTMTDMMMILDPDFVGEILLEWVDKEFSMIRFTRSSNVAAYLLCTKDENIQTERYTKILLPALVRTLPLWEVKNTKDDCYWNSLNVIEVLKDLSKYFPKYVLEEKMVFPVKLFTDILQLLEKSLPIENNYLTLRTWKLFVAFVKILEEHKDCVADIPKYKHYSRHYYPAAMTTLKDFYKKALPKFSAIALQYLKEDCEQYFQSIYCIFTDALRHALINVNRVVFMECLKTLVDATDYVPAYLIVIKAIPQTFYSEDEEEEALAGVVRQKIHSHPSAEVKVHYYQRYKHHDLKDTVCDIVMH